ncbi:MAG: hypothetical protein A3J54_01595 [Candidatus Ryanbacteria bacterium RIFCSPHIGHO2_02_FULL_45_13b]|uniref:FAD/NAD(P)-binding domain-containing protein n=1 Tax=Candidatus Ryanbacteria bacterium RIFCSPHIGHO2_02_FULL_45_13b TaxID=1802117 RepID=A0A1G2G8T6_9BACT|nr:MAG: hypothetical protein A3J54_01595 [Candidatus Ryanbacteria bacterium RIFCSPHIGHO2_02_FULL_45_13b]
MHIEADYLIIGGGIAGTTAAETIRNKDKHGTIAIISKEPHVLYSRVLLPKYVEGALARDQVFLRTAEDYNKRGISLYVDEEATVLDLKRKEVRTRKGVVFSYKQLLIAAGGRVKPWHVKGSEDVSVMRFHTIDDASMLYDKLSGKQAKDVVIVGGGFIALELINALRSRGLSHIHCIVPERRFWEHHLDDAGSAIIERYLQENGILLHLNETVTMLQRTDEGRSAVYTNRTISYDADILMVGIGLDREVKTFSGGGIEVQRGIITDEFLETGVKGVWAAGDIAEYYSLAFGRNLLVGNWSNAFLQGRIAGLNMVFRHTALGSAEVFGYVPLYAITVLGMHIAFLGDVSGAKDRSGRTFISRFQEEWYERFFLEDNKLVGAVFINKFEDKQVIELLIKEQRDCAPFISYLSDPTVTLADYIT